ncbi:transcriptional regulator, TetR family [Streptomyces sp. WMMB 714]|uniref:TetR/AcrR family transcriptional regulator n=1 Tax=Streptomyces sp. WMMB 714 TaxID=1286822 RepID=UPI0005F88C73|nr:TetR/AcrR family transcriptional regulator [Streptomyces sp. WMMB 714]SCK12554.1 transcriptional regulator, TetR family [Streptomyces sp. WMMB 714]
MPTARETLLEAAHAAVGTQPWPGVRMVDVAAAAGVSRQTLYNEFGTKEGLGAALVDRLVEGFLDGAARAAAEAGRGEDPAASCAGAASWMLRAARDEPVVRSALTGCWGGRMPPPGTGGDGSAEDGAEPGRLAAALCERMMSSLSPNGHAATLNRACEAGVRIALSFVVAPHAGRGDEEALRQVRDVVRALLADSH